MSKWDKKIESMKKDLKDDKHKLMPWEVKARRREIDKQFFHFESGKAAFERLLGKGQSNYERNGLYVASITGVESFQGTSRRSKRDACRSLYAIMEGYIGKMKVMANADRCKLCSTYCTTVESLEKHLLGHDHLKQCNCRLAKTQYWRSLDVVDLPGIKKGRIVSVSRRGKFILAPTGGLGSNCQWEVLPDEIEMPRLRIPSLANFDGTGKLRVDIANGRFDYDLYSRLDLKAVQKWFSRALDADVRKINVLGTQREVSLMCADFGWPHSVTNLLLQFAGFWGLHVYFHGTGKLWWEKGSFLVSKSGTFV